MREGERDERGREREGCVSSRKEKDKIERLLHDTTLRCEHSGSARCLKRGKLRL